MPNPPTASPRPAWCDRRLIAALPCAALALLLAAGCAQSRSRTWAQFSPLIQPIEIAPFPDLSLGAARDADPESCEAPEADDREQPDEPARCDSCGFDHHAEN